MPQIPYTTARYREVPTAARAPRFRTYLAFVTGIVVVLALGGSL